MDLEKKCRDEEIHISTEGIPIIPEDQLDVKDDSVEDSRIIQMKSQLPRKIYAPLGDPEFWLKVHIGLLEYALRTVEESKMEQKIAEARIELIQSDLCKQYAEKIRLGEELEKEKKLSESYRFGIQLALLLADNKIEEKEKIIEMYEERFGPREELLKLAQAEENCELNRRCQTKGYNLISKLIELHKTGKCPKTTGQRITDFLEKLLSPKTYAKIAGEIYSAFRGKTKENMCG